MKQAFIILFSTALISCNQETSSGKVSDTGVDSSHHAMNEAYKPGFGDLMGIIQVHHNKLWFAGENENWKLADFEVHEISEAIDDIKDLQKGRKESAMLDMLQPSLDKIDTAVGQKNLSLFKQGYVLLTTTCNNCHRQTNYEFITIKIPESPPFSNQEFKLQNQQ